jgi:hypothetical protein
LLLQVTNNCKHKGARGWLLYDFSELLALDQEPGSPADAAAADTAAAAAARAPATGLAQWLVKMVPGLSVGVLQQMGCLALDQLLLVPGLFESLVLVVPADREGCPGNM